MNTDKFVQRISEEVEEHGRMSVWVNVGGSLVPLESVRVQIMRDEIDVPILVLEPEAK